MFEENMNDKYEYLSSKTNLHSHSYSICIKNKLIWNAMISIIKCVIVIALFLSAVGMGILFTLIIKSNNYNIHTGCKHNDTIYRDNNTKYQPHYCISNDTGKLYSRFSCSINNPNDIWGICFSLAFSLTLVLSQSWLL